MMDFDQARADQIAGRAVQQVSFVPHFRTARRASRWSLDFLMRLQTGPHK